jgi:hypothetical protein
MEEIHLRLKKAVDFASPLEKFREAVGGVSVELDKFDIDFILVCRDLLPQLLKINSDLMDQVGELECEIEAAEWIVEDVTDENLGLMAKIEELEERIAIMSENQTIHPEGWDG